ncbi:plexin domain-containing protein 1-like isoform X2 [Penaeus japonicus]|uniref:plexin domain-containing protein 1-like isoform X2 n=1 Tax=Penaeus japonicus TaxID=27405 RepID=UPI001C71120D|nr:plexin domain-containing protein 1-like isoform X2 [Penaeus japonicus]
MTTDPTKILKGDKIPTKTELKKKNPFPKKGSPPAKSATTTTTTTSTTTTTTTTPTTSTTTTMSPSTLPPVELEAGSSGTTAAPLGSTVASATTSTTSKTAVTGPTTTSSQANGNEDENRTNESSKNTSEEKNEKSDSPKEVGDTASQDADTPDQQLLSEDDPDSGDNSVSPVDGFITKNTTVDHHRYYQSFTYAGIDKAGHYWVDLNASENVVKNEMLSASHRRAATVTLTFDFPFYGHLLRNITIATGGFLFTGDFVHTWLAATQYIAPLMANFDTSLSKNAYVKYADNGTSFTVQWNNVLLKDHKDAGTFTFQVTLHETGDIVFIYKDIPLIVSSIGDDQHPVKVGLSDAYIVDRTIFYVRRKTIYEYHKIDMKKNSVIGNWTAIVFKALPTCVSFNSCEKCLSSDISFDCQWCNRIGRCSNGLDRHRQEWLHNSCESTSIQNSWECANLPPVPSSTDNPYQTASPTSVDTFGHNARVEPANRGSDSSSATNNNNGSNSPSQQNSSANLPTPTTPPVHSNTSSANASTGNQDNTNDPDIGTGSKQNRDPNTDTSSSSNKGNKNSTNSSSYNPLVPKAPSDTVNASYSPNAFPGYPSMPYPGSHSALDASDSSKGIVTDGEPDTLAHTSGRDEDGGSSVGVVVGVVFLMALVLGIGGWIAYAYFFPHSSSGQILIRYRPSTWSWKRGEARYTAAAIHSIHM